MDLMNSLAIYITSMRWRIPVTRAIRRKVECCRTSKYGSLLATNIADATVQPRWGKIGKQKIEDAGALCPERMETVDDEILANSLKFLDKARADKKPFFLWLNPTRMHVTTHLSPKYQAMRNSENGWL